MQTIGFNRKILLPWLDVTAALRAETDDPGVIRQRLTPIIHQDIASPTNRRKTIAILLNIWCHADNTAPELRRYAVNSYQTAPANARLWLHYGMTLLAYPFFREVTLAIGQISRLNDAFETTAVRQRLAFSIGQPGSLKEALNRIILSMRDWGILLETDQRYRYALQRKHFVTADQDVETWLLACALHAHPAEELPFTDLLRLPELFPFRFSVTLDHLHQNPLFTIQRQGMGWDMVRAVQPRSQTG